VYHIGPGKLYRLSQVVETLKQLVPEAKISVGPGMLPYVTQSPVRGPLDIRRAERDLNYREQYSLHEALAHFIETVRTRSRKA
jgi:nucleoside-diphosphate-sugar epimerase